MTTKCDHCNGTNGVQFFEDDKKYLGEDISGFYCKSCRDFMTPTVEDLGDFLTFQPVDLIDTYSVPSRILRQLPEPPDPLFNYYENMIGNYHNFEEDYEEWEL